MKSKKIRLENPEALIPTHMTLKNQQGFGYYFHREDGLFEVISQDEESITIRIVKNE